MAVEALAMEVRAVKASVSTALADYEALRRGLEASLLSLGDHHHQQIASEENVHLALRAGDTFRASRPSAPTRTITRGVTHSTCSNERNTER
jgi:hypothetical protein